MFVDWGQLAPQWLASLLPNSEAEIGAVLSLIGNPPLYWQQYQAARDAFRLM